LKAETPPRPWAADIYRAFKKLGVAQVAYVPDGAHIKNRFRENLLGQKAFD